MAESVVASLFLGWQSTSLRSCSALFYLGTLPGLHSACKCVYKYDHTLTMEQRRIQLSVVDTDLGYNSFL